MTSWSSQLFTPVSIAQCGEGVVTRMIVRGSAYPIGAIGLKLSSGRADVEYLANLNAIGNEVPCVQHRYQTLQGKGPEPNQVWLM